MARQISGPWFRKGTDSWYATGDGGRKVSLGVKGKGNRKEAWAVWSRLMCTDFRDMQIPPTLGGIWPTCPNRFPLHPRHPSPSRL